MHFLHPQAADHLDSDAFENPGVELHLNPNSGRSALLRGNRLNRKDQQAKNEQAAGVMDNDGWKQIAGFTDLFDVDKDHPRVEVYFRKINARDEEVDPGANAA